MLRYVQHDTLSMRDASDSRLALFPGVLASGLMGGTGAHGVFRNRRSPIRNRQSISGQSMVESALVLVFLSFVLFGMLQVALKLNAEQIQNFGSYVAARSRIVGFNDGVVQKAWLIGNILNSGEMRAPEAGLTAVAQVAVESWAIPDFLQSSYTAWELQPQLNYEFWENFPNVPSAGPFDTYTATSEYEFPLVIARALPILAGSMGGTNATVRSTVTMENHFPFYLQWN